MVNKLDKFILEIDISDSKSKVGTYSTMIVHLVAILLGLHSQQTTE